MATGTLPLAAAVAVELAESGRPVLAAGGVVNGKGLLAALALGCDGVVMGTRCDHFLRVRRIPLARTVGIAQPITCV